MVRKLCFTVSSETFSSEQIPLLLRPLANKFNTSISRGLMSAFRRRFSSRVATRSGNVNCRNRKGKGWNFSEISSEFGLKFSILFSLCGVSNSESGGMPDSIGWNRGLVARTGIEPVFQP